MACSSRARHPRRDRLGPRHRRAASIVADGVNALRAPGPRHRRWSPTTSACSTTSCRTTCTCWPAAASSSSGGKELALELEAKGYAGWSSERRSAAASVSIDRCARSAKSVEAPAARSTAVRRVRQLAGSTRCARRRSKRFAAHGFPTARDEDWKYTRPRAARRPHPLLRRRRNRPHRRRQRRIDWRRLHEAAPLVFVERPFRPDLSARQCLTARRIVACAGADLTSASRIAAASRCRAFGRRAVRSH